MVKEGRGSGIWAEGRYLDLWSLVHVIGGGLLAGIFVFLEISLLYSFIASFLILLFWEIFETLRGIKEFPTNIVSDMVVGTAGFFIVWFLMISNTMNNIALFSILAIIFIILDILGFLAYTKRSKK